jgi:uncharacterized protein
MPLSPAVGTAPAHGLGPVLSKERIEILDILRGFALFGILWVNMDGVGEPVWETWHDHIIFRLDDLLANGKFWPLFSFLFGLGFALQMLRAETRGVRIVPLYTRRLLILFVIGSAHHVLLPNAEILSNYAILGIVLLLFRACSPRVLLVFVGLGLSYCFLWGPVVERVTQHLQVDPRTARANSQRAAVRRVDEQVREEERIRDRSRGTYAEVVAKRAKHAAARYSRWQFYVDESMIWILCFFLLGLYAGRRGIFQNPREHLPFLNKMMWWGLGVGLLGNLLRIATWEHVYYFQDVNPVFIGALVHILTLFYVAGLTLLVQQASWRRRLQPLASAGRMALSNYVLQSLIMTTLFYGYGFGLYLSASASLILVLVLAIYAFEVLLSVWWLRRFQFGPLEWVWRTLTYGKLQPMRVQTVQVVSS